MTTMNKTNTFNNTTSNNNKFLNTTSAVVVETLRFLHTISLSISILTLN